MSPKLLLTITSPLAYPPEVSGWGGVLGWGH